MGIKVVSQNTMCWEHINGALYKNRRPLLKKAIERGDIIGLQEVTPLWANAFAEELPEYDMFLVYRGENDTEATPIMWKKDRFERLDSGHFWLSETPEKESVSWGSCCRRICCWIKFLDREDGCEFVFVNTHLDHVSEEARIKGIQLICGFIKEKFGNIPLILTGDFNAEPGSPTIDAANALLTDARRSFGIKEFEDTFHGFGIQAKCCIDYIYISDKIECTGFELIKEQSGRSIQSDHYGLCAEIAIR